MHTPDSPSDSSSQRPDWACSLHKPPTGETEPWWPADQHYATCSGCLDRLRAAMSDLRRRYFLLDARPGRAMESGARPAPGFGSRSPASEHVLAFTDIRSSQTARVWTDRAGRVCREDERPPVSVRGELDLLAWTVSEHLSCPGPDPRADVGDLLRYVDRRLDAVTRDGELAVTVAFTIRALVTALKPMTGDPRPRFIGFCPAVAETVPDLGFAPAYDTDPGVEIRCAARLYAPMRGDLVACHECDAQWPRAAWQRLGEAMTHLGLVVAA